MALNRRFSDESYKNWLKTTLSLQLLRAALRRFVESETETFHGALRSRLGDERCQRQCDVKGYAPKAPSVCNACRRWMDEILKHHSNKNGRIYWNNCRPSKWSSDKWEVAKVYMPGGNRAHSTIDQFDISAILNFMTFCTHFEPFARKHILTEVTNVRNQMMHSPEMKVKKEEMEQHLKKILKLAALLQHHAPEMVTLLEQIAQLQNTELSIIPEGLDPSSATPQKEIIQNLLSVQKMQDLEQQVLKEKIEFLSRCLEEGRNTRTEVEGLRNFLDQNKDLLEELRPQVEQLDEIQRKVQRHEQQLSDLAEKVDSLERMSSEPVYSADPVRYKNHLLELATKNQWPAPAFSEIRKPQGFTGQVEVNGQTFAGQHVHRNITAAHQEVSKLALDQLSSCTQSTGTAEARASVPPGMANAAPYFSSVTVVLDIDVSSSEGDRGKEEATESAYKNLAELLRPDELIPGSSYKLAVQQYFLKRGFQQPQELFPTDADGKSCCVLKLSGPFTFQGEEGSTKKRLAEQQAAKAALLTLSGLLGQKAVSGDNYKGALKELLEQRGLKPPVYTEVSTSEALLAEVGSSTSHSVCSSQNELAQSLPAKLPEELRGKATDQSSARAEPTSRARPVTQAASAESEAPLVPIMQDLEGQETHSSYAGNAGEAADRSNSPHVARHSADRSVLTASGQFYAAVKVPVKRELPGPEARTKEDAIRAAYVALAEAFGLENPTSASSAVSMREVVHGFFSKSECQCNEYCETTAEGKFVCKLHICGDLAFENQEGTSRKQQAEQGAAKEALARLAKVLDWDLSDTNGNYKGKLQELLAKQGEMPSYQTRDGPGVTEPSGERTADPASMNISTGETSSVGDAGNTAMPSVPSRQPSPARKRKIHDTEYVCGTKIERMLQISGFQPPLVTVEDLVATERFAFNMEIHLADFTFQNQQGHGSKKDALRNTYLKFGRALGLCESDTAEDQSVRIVKDHFKRKFFKLPCDDTKREKDKFFGLLRAERFSYTCEGKGPSEQVAIREASALALDRLAHLFNYKTVARTLGDDDAETKLRVLLEELRQPDPSFHMAAEYSVSVKLCFSDFTLESIDQNKKSARNKLCARILGLLGEDDSETSISASVRNRVDDWFKKRRLSPPQFDDTSEGARVTFTVTLTFSHPGWEGSLEAAEEKLAGEMTARLGHLAEGAAV